MFGENKYKNKKENLIYKRQKHEEYYRRANANVRDYNIIKSNVDHWSREDKRYARLVQIQAAEAEEKRKQEVENQRLVLEEKRVHEQQRITETKPTKLTTADRLKLLEAEALKLENQNQKRRQQFVNKAKQKRLLESSDELRQERSRLLLQYCDMERRKMTEQKRQEAMLQEKGKKNFADAWIQEAKRKEERELREREEKRKRDLAFYDDINQQNEKRAQDKALREEQHKREIQELYQKLKAQYEEDEAKRKQAAQEKARRLKESLADFEGAERRKQDRRRRELQEDKEWVKKVVESEKKEQSNAAELKMKFKEDQERYMEYNRKLKKMAEENDKLISEHADREQQKMWLKRESIWKKEQAARERLARQVQLERIEQRRQKIHRSNLERKRDASYHSSLMNRLRQQEEEDKLKEKERLRRKNELLQETIAAVHSREELLKNEAQADKENIANDHEEWNRLIEEQKQLMRKMAAENPEEFFRHQKIKANWYTA